MRFDQSKFAEFYNRQQIQGGYPGKLLPFILRELEGLHTVIDIGSGTGLISIPLVSAGCKVTAVEPSVEMITVMNRNTPAQYRSSLKSFNIAWEKWSGNLHDAAIMVHSVYPMKDIRKAIELMNFSAGKKILIVRDTIKMKTLSSVIKKRLGLLLSRDLNHEIAGILDNISPDWRIENIYEERKHPVKSIDDETDEIIYQLELDDTYREKVTGILNEIICLDGHEFFFNAVFSDNAYIF